MPKRHKPIRQNVTKQNQRHPSRKAVSKKPGGKRPRQRTGKSTVRGKSKGKGSVMVRKATRRTQKRAIGLRASRKNTTGKAGKGKPSKIRRPGNTKAVKPRLSGKGKRRINKGARVVSKKKPAKGRKKTTSARGERFSYRLDVPNNHIDIFLPSGSFKKKLDAVKGSPFDCLTPLQDKQANYTEEQKAASIEETGKQWLPFPQAVLTTLTSQREAGEADQKKEFFRNKITPFDLVINNASVKAFVIEQMINYQDNWIEMKDEKDPEDMEGYELQADPVKLFKIRINYIY